MSICVLGSVNQDLVVRVADLPKAGETVTGHAVSTHLGGKGANQAVAIARMGGSPVFAGATGTDEISVWMRERLEASGVDTEQLVALDGVPSGQALVTVSEAGENSVVVVGGANLAITAANLSKQVLAGHAVYLSQLETPVDVIAALFSDPSAASGVRVLNAAPSISEGQKLFAMIDILIVNETELAAYAGCAATDAEPLDCVDGARGLIERAGQSVLVTLGAGGLMLVTTGAEIRIPGHDVRAVDTTGAGDCFCGVVAAELARGESLESAARFANAAAALAVTKAGASTSMPSREDVEAFVARRP